MGNEFYQDAKNALANLGLPLVGIVLIIIALFFTDKIKIWVGWIQYAGAYVFHSLKKASIKNRLEGSCSRALRLIGKELPDFEIPDLSIEWVRGKNFDTKLKEGKAIVKLKFSNDQTRNVVNATSVYVRDAFLKHAKPYFSESLRKSIDFSITRKILLHINKNQRNVISYFIDEYAKDIETFKDKCTQIEEIDNAGFLTRILIRELDYYGNKLTGTIPNIENFNEADSFLSYLYEIARREADDNTQLQFVDKTLKVGVLLVAKKETYLTHGLEAYLRRIRLGLARGIKTFYLLAREDRVEILEDIAKELLTTGNFTLINKPLEFLDNHDRSVICYCIRIDKESSMAIAYNIINESIDSKHPIKGIIVKVRHDELKVNVDGVEGFVRKHNLSISQIDEIDKYFKDSMQVELIPLEIIKGGLVEFSIKGTNSDPYKIVSLNFKIGNTLKAKVKYSDDDFIKLDLDNNIEGIAFRSDLTFSRYVFLHEKFPVDEEFEFIIKNIDFEDNRIHLQHTELRDPWSRFIGTKGSPVDFTICKKNEKACFGEIKEGIEAILPYSELAWFETEIKTIKSSIKLNQTIKGFIKEINKEKRVVYLSLCNPKENPYIDFFRKYRNKTVKCTLSQQNSFGVLGLIENKYKLFIPNGELSRGGSKYNFKFNVETDVAIKEINERLDSIIGSFKPLVAYPLQAFTESYKEGQVLKTLNRKSSFNEGVAFEIKDNGKIYEAILFRGEISDICYVESCKDLFNSISNLPLIIKKIDLERNKILLSLKEFVLNSKATHNDLSYSDSYKSIVLGKTQNNYAVLLQDIWVEGILETTRSYKTGDIVIVRPSKLSGDPIFLTENE
ncbi:SSU ribosomal protein S1p [Aquipluma nitroreducens]|uniref:SSU ribosomal protein S1p n=1 Tax=Aquipluma nitroreducens TaxID=2010828 RepID=A0A5K7S487_9BACT|nr:hypothetical protein [Aquipluma nitroreducens]BBE16290.1 SSU ribosomal protein S1p [Aquipluma nitroreducens]